MNQRKDGVCNNEKKFWIYLRHLHLPPLRLLPRVRIAPSSLSPRFTARLLAFRITVTLDAMNIAPLSEQCLAVVAALLNKAALRESVVVAVTALPIELVEVRRLCDAMDSLGCAASHSALGQQRPPHREPPCTAHRGSRSARYAHAPSRLRSTLMRPQWTSRAARSPAPLSPTSLNSPRYTNSTSANAPLMTASSQPSPPDAPS